MNYGYGPQEMDKAQNLVVRAGRRADPPIYDAYALDRIPLKGSNDCLDILQDYVLLDILSLTGFRLIGSNYSDQSDPIKPVVLNLFIYPLAW